MSKCPFYVRELCELQVYAPDPRSPENNILDKLPPRLLGVHLNGVDQLVPIYLRKTADTFGQQIGKEGLADHVEIDGRSG